MAAAIGAENASTAGLRHVPEKFLIQSVSQSIRTCRFQTMDDSRGMDASSRAAGEPGRRTSRSGERKVTKNKTTAEGSGKTPG
jgi:hypothetical protein